MTTKTINIKDDKALEVLKSLACIIHKNSRKAAKAQRISKLKECFKQIQFYFSNNYHCQIYTNSTLCVFAPWRGEFFRLESIYFIEFVENDKIIYLKSLKPKNESKEDKLLDLQGIWKNRDISIQQIREIAWPQRK